MVISGSYKREATVSSSSVHQSQKISVPVKERGRPANKTLRTDTSEVTARAPDENKKKKTLVCV
jgi:hypothetical protein